MFFSDIPLYGLVGGHGQHNSMQLTWVPPACDGGTAILGFLVEVQAGADGFTQAANASGLLGCRYGQPYLACPYFLLH